MAQIIDTKKTRSIDGLRACPFCGSNDSRVWHLSATVEIACKKCGSTGPSIEIDFSMDAGGSKEAEEKAIAAWNRRNKRRNQ